MLARRALIVVMVLFLAWQWLLHRDPMHASTAMPTATASSTENGRALSDDNAGLPPEAQSTLRLIASNGPFPYDRDGVVFGNFEHRLPEQPRGYYHEYTVPTPGASNRGARRIIAGGAPPEVFYYTGDHYQSFIRIEAKP